MKIPLHLSLPTPSSSSLSSPRNTASIPPPLLELTPNGELVLFELQGSLEISGSSQTQDGEEERQGRGDTLGKFVFEDGRLVRSLPYPPRFRLTLRGIERVKLTSDDDDDDHHQRRNRTVRHF